MNTTPDPKPRHYGRRPSKRGAGGSITGAILYDDMVTAITNFIVYEASRLMDDLVSVAHIPVEGLPPEHLLASTVNDILIGNGQENGDAYDGYMRDMIGQMRGMVAGSVESRLKSRYREEKEVKRDG